jgi:hypothetical protein
MKGIKDFISKLGSDGGYKYDYDPTTQTYTQLSGPGSSENSPGRKIMSRLLQFVDKNEPRYSYNPQDQAYKQLSGFGMKKGGKVSSASKRADGCAIRGKTKGKFV